MVRHNTYIVQHRTVLNYAPRNQHSSVIWSFGQDDDNSHSWSREKHEKQGE